MHRHTEDIRNTPVEEIMTKDFERIHKKTPVTQVLETFEKRDTECLAVVDEEDNFLGDVHKRDVLKLAIDPKHMSEHDIIGYMGTTIDESYFADEVEDLMERHDVTADPGTAVQNVVLKMWKENVRSVPVTDGSKIVGIVFEEDVIEKVIEKLRKVDE